MKFAEVVNEVIETHFFLYDFLNKVSPLEAFNYNEIMISKIDKHIELNEY